MNSPALSKKTSGFGYGPITKLGFGLGAPEGSETVKVELSEGNHSG
jgi:hypothetical protein